MTDHSSCIAEIRVLNERIREISTERDEPNEAISESRSILCFYGEDLQHGIRDIIEELHDLAEAAFQFREQLHCYSTGISALSEDGMKPLDEELVRLICNIRGNK